MTYVQEVHQVGMESKTGLGARNSLLCDPESDAVFFFSQYYSTSASALNIPNQLLLGCIEMNNRG